MLKLLIWIILGIIIYRAVKSWLAGGASRHQDHLSGNQPAPADDLMIQDPACGTYFPRREGVLVVHNGQTLHFCSAGCRDRYLQEHGNAK